MIVSAIVAAASNHVIGDGAGLPWHLSTDMKYFKRVTLDHHVIMGRKTFDSIDRPLPKRTNIVITRDLLYAGTGILVAHSVEEALTIAYDNDETEAFIVGGGEIYRESMAYCDKIYLTRVLAEPAGSVFFPELDPATWELSSSEAHPASEKDDHAFVIEVYTRKQ
ncbi:MAG: diacylglycerol kinase [Bacteroidetes bacterium]|nr:MAG: diacylglycerol kinase [Bacteroidota bacterium]PTM14741.1 MAG: diacylglycerol kinase [Bacteroidota bacterium]